MRKLLFLLLLFPFFIFADDYELLNVSSSFVTDHVVDKQENFFVKESYDPILPKVNPVTGEYSDDEIDLVVAGGEPLSIRRFYHHLSPRDPRYADWQYNPETFFVANFESDKLGVFATKGSFYGNVHSFKRVGKCAFGFSCPSNFTASTAEEHPLNIKINYTKNFPSKNKKYFEFIGKVSGESFHECSFKSSKSCWNHSIIYRVKKGNFFGGSEDTYKITPRVWTPYQVPIVEERLPNGNIISYEYITWKKEKQHFPLPKLLGCIKAYNSNKTKVLGKIKFEYPRYKHHEVAGIKITGSDGRFVRIKHSQNLLLTSAEASGRPLISYGFQNNKLISVKKGNIEFRTEYDGSNRVRAQYSNAGPNGEVVAIARYEYQANHTVVYDAEGNKTAYYFDGNKRLTAIDKGLFVTRFSWDDKTGNLLSQRIEENGRLRKETKYQYDGHQNLVLETTGDGSLWRSIHRSYDDNNRKTSEWSNEECVTRYSYVPRTNLISSELVYNGNQIRKRAFHFYDDCAVCVRTIVDDGRSENPNDLTAVTYRKISEVIPKSSIPCFGLPEWRIEKTICNGSEVLLSKIRYSYTSYGKVLQEDHYDANGNLRYSINNSYDANERLISTTTPLGYRTNFSYDKNYNLVSVSGPRSDVSRELCYDGANRLIKILDKQSDGKILVIEKKYDRLSRVVEEVDPCGKRTNFTYDALGRVTSTKNPDGGIFRREYDVFGNIIKEIDELGYETIKTYNVFNQILSVKNPDGSSESFSYDGLGRVVKHIDKNGAIKLYSYDIFDHPVESKIISQSGELLRLTRSTWTPFFKLSETSGDETTTFGYDFSGRKILEKKGYSQKSFSYDALGNLTTTLEGNSKSIEEFDLAGNVIHKHLETNGIVQTKEDYRYDELGMRTHLINCDGVTETAYNTQKQPIYTKDPFGNKTSFSYIYGEMWTKIVTDPRGIKTETSSDCMGREISNLKKDRNGSVIQKADKQYDKRGNLVQVIHTVFSGSIGSVVHRWEYGPAGVVRFIESGERITGYEYDCYGRLQSIIKPDGNRNTYEYDALGRVSRFYGSDFDYRYTYDQNDRIIKCSDGTLRRYDALGNVLEEKLANGLMLRSVYDDRGRRSKLILPEGSIDYSYEGVFLKTVSYKDFVHTYDRDLLGRIILSRTPIGDVKFTRRLYLLGIDSQYFKSSAAYDEVGNIVSNAYEDPSGKVFCRYEYDGLDQLVKEDAHSYKYDSLYNRIQKDGISHPTDKLCRYTEYKYDSCGNLISDGRNTYTYDTLDRLVSVSSKDFQITYSYDAFNRRLSKGGIKYLWDGENEIGSLGQIRILGEGFGAEIGAAVFYDFSGKIYIPIHDNRGSVVVLVSQDKTIIDSYRYTAFGEECCSKHISPWRFSSKRVDESGLIFFGRRYYVSFLGRWLTRDPRGMEEGPNLYAYLSNNLRAVDLYGLSAYTPCRSFLLPTPNYIGFSQYKNFEGLFSNKSRVYDLGRKKLKNDGCIFFVNGMNNSFDEAFGYATYLSDLSGGYDVTGTYNANHGIMNDLFECKSNLMNRCATNPVLCIRQMWDNYFDNVGDKSMALHFCTSQGSILTRLALEDYPKERRDRLSVVAIAPAAFIDRSMCGGIRHYMADSVFRDPIPRLDRAGYNKSLDTIVRLPSHPNAPWFDHKFVSPTYKSQIRREINEYMKHIGIE